MESVDKLAKKLPTKPGVYLFHNDKDEVIYVGKAVNLRSRVSSYFRASANLTLAKEIMVGEIKRIEHIIVRSETEALLLESTLIKKYRPKYNIILKDDKFFQYIKIALRETYPQVSTVRKIAIDGSRYFGPYTSGLAVRQTMRLLKRLFPYKSCNNKPSVPCFDYQLGRCLGHNVEPHSRERYRQVIGKLIDFLEGRTGNVLKDIQRQMKSAAARRNFEQAALYRDRWQALRHVIEQQIVVTPRRDSFDVISLARRASLAAVNLFQIRQGKLVQRDQFILQHVGGRSDEEVTSAFIEQYYSQSTVHPRDVFTPVAVPLTVGNALQLRVTAARRGLKHKLLLMGRENAADYLQREQDKWLSETAKANLALTELAHALNLDGPLKRIEMYDISNFQGQHAVGSMVVFDDGRPKKSDYRKFAIKTIRGSDDVRMLAEVLRRRFSHHGNTTNDADGSPPNSPPVVSGGQPRTSGEEEVRGGVRGGGAWPMPDLIVLDGGKPQLSTVIKLVPGLLQHIPVIALAKEHEEIYLPGTNRPIRLPAESQELFLIQRIRDEAHRFAIGYYRRKHRGATTRSALDEIPGLGQINRARLLKKFGSVDKIRQADDSDISKIIGPRLTTILRKNI